MRKIINGYYRFLKILLASLSEESLLSIVKERGLPRRTENTITDLEELKKHLQIIREQGFAFDDEENEKGIQCVGAPIIDQRGKVLAAISISVPTIRVDKTTLQTTLKDHLTETAAQISRKIGYQGSQVYLTNL